MRALDSSWVRLSVCGQRFTVSRETLTRLEPESMLARMFQTTHSTLMQPAAVDEHGYYLLDRDPVLFASILQYLRTGLVPAAPDRAALLTEARYFQLGGLESVLARPEPDFTRGELVRALTGASLREHALVGVRLCALDLSGLNLASLDLSGAQLDLCQLARTTLCSSLFVKCSARNAQITDAACEKANFFGADLTGSSFARSDLGSAIFSHALMCGVDLSRARLQHSIMQRTTLRGAKLAGADLSDCHLQDANCVDCDFSGVVGMERAHFADADLRGARIDWEKLAGAYWFRGARVTQEQYEAIPLSADVKAALKLRVISGVETEDERQVREQIKQYDIVVYVLGYGAVSRHGEQCEIEPGCCLCAQVDHRSFARDCGARGSVAAVHLAHCGRRGPSASHHDALSHLRDQAVAQGLLPGPVLGRPRCDDAMDCFGMPAT